MGRVDEKELVTLEGFPLGLNNVTPDEDLPPAEALQSLRVAVDVDLIGPKKRPRQRDGYTRTWSGRCHSPQEVGASLLLVCDGQLVALDESLTDDTLVRADVGARRISWADVNGDRWWSNGEIIRRLRAADLKDLPCWIECAGIPQCHATTGYGLEAGEYRVALTWFNAEGHESGAAGICLVDVGATGGISVTNIPAPPEGAVRMRLYLSPPNDSELYAAADLVPGVTTSYVLGNANTDGRALSSFQATVFPPCTLLRYWNGRLIGAAGNVLRWSLSGYTGLTHHNNYMRCGTKINLIEPIGDGTDGAGAFMSDHKYTYWLAGAKPEDWRRAVVSEHPAVFGASLVVTARNIGLDAAGQCAVWLGADGVLYAGLPGGSIQALNDANKVVMPEGESGSLLFRQSNGMRQLIASFLTRGDGANRLTIRDRVSATVTQHFTP